MILAKLIEGLNQLVNDNPKLKNYSVKFRSENGQHEGITHYHTEGRTLILSDVWALDALTPDSPDYPKMKDKIKELLSDEVEKSEDQVNVAKQNKSE